MSDSTKDLKNQLEKLKKSFNTSELRIAELQKENATIIKSKETLDLEITNLRKENLALSKEIAQAQGNADISLVRRNADLEVSLQKSELTRKDLLQHVSELETERVKYLESNKVLLEEKKELDTKLTTVNNTISTSYSAEDLSQYLTKTIEDFNKNTSLEDNYAKYVINSLDIDLKAQVYHDENKNLRFSAPNLEKTTENSLSSIKISIRAIPK